MRSSITLSFTVACSALAIFSGVACSSSTQATTGATGDGGTAATTPTFTNVYETVIAKRCVDCHTTANGEGITEGKLDMTTKAAAYASLVGVQAGGPECGGKGVRVVPGKPDDSLLYKKVSLDDPTPCDTKMPEGAAPLTQAQIDLIEAWITAGAKND